MAEAIVLTLLFTCGFVVFGLVAGAIVGRMLSGVLLSPLARSDERGRLLSRSTVCAAVTSAVVAGLIGVMAMLFDGPGAALWR